MAEVACHQFKVMIEGRGCNLKVGVGEDVPTPLQIGADPSEDPGDREIVGEGGYGRKNTLLYVLQVALLGRGAIRALEELTNGDGARELGLPRDRLEPIQIGLKRTGTE